jgi:hypothetical protein
MRQIQVSGARWAEVLGGEVYRTEGVRLEGVRYVVSIWIEKKAGLCVRLERMPKEPRGETERLMEAGS